MRKKGTDLVEAQVEDDPSTVPGSSPGLRRTNGLGGPEPSTRSGQAVGGDVPLPDFAPVPRRYRHDGWTPERQRAFIEALADTGCVTRAAGMVNMAQANCYTLRRAAGAEGFRRAWDAALDFGLKRLKDIAFERAIEGQLVPVFVAGKLMGFRRKRNDALLMFCLRHYGQDANGKRTTINYFSTRAASTSSAQAGAGAVAGDPSTALGTNGGGVAASEASTTTVRTVISGPSTGLGTIGESGDEAAALLGGFEGIELDPEAEAAIAAALEACAARARAADEAGVADDAESFVRVGEQENPFLGELEPPTALEEYVPFADGEAPWMLAGADKPAALVEFEERQAAQRLEGLKEGQALTPTSSAQSIVSQTIAPHSSRKREREE